MTKTGWWSVRFEVTLEGVGIDFDELSDCSQEHILKMIAEGFKSGEVVEEDDKDDNCANHTYDCDTCACNGDCTLQGMDGKPKWMEEEDEDA